MTLRWRRGDSPEAAEVPLAVPGPRSPQPHLSTKDDVERRARVPRGRRPLTTGDTCAQVNVAEGAGWVSTHLVPLRSSIRMLFGVLWGIDGALKFLPNTVFWFQERMIAVGIGQPAFLAGWFSFWLAEADAYGALDVALIASVELALCVSLVLGVLRKVAYVEGIAVSLLIWAVPEGFGGPYDEGTFDVGVGIIYAVVFLSLILLDAGQRSNWRTLDVWIEARWPRWARWAEVSIPVERSPTDRPEASDPGSGGTGPRLGTDGGP